MRGSRRWRADTKSGPLTDLAHDGSYGGNLDLQGGP